MARWEILRGLVSDKSFRPIHLVEVPGVERVKGDGTFYQGDVIETDKDLSKYNTPIETKYKKIAEVVSPRKASRTKQGESVTS